MKQFAWHVTAGRYVECGRLPCIAKGCRRTAAAEKYPGCTEIVCYKCWKTIPLALRQRDRQLRKRERSLLRMWRKRGEENPDLPVIAREFGANWAKIHEFFRAPEKPVNLDGFLQEMGFE